jgi:hypothetical protein
MTFSAKQAIAALELEPFEYEDADGVLQQLPHVKSLSPAHATRVIVDGDFIGVLNEVAPGQGDSVGRLPTAVVEQLVAAWIEHGGISLASPGKRQKPSPSTTSTATRSKRTSRSAGSRSRK